MSKIRRNILANTLGRGWSMFLGIAILPFYVRFLGPEAYGLVGLYGTISVICSLFDAGISASLGRELASANATPGQQTAELVRTAEIIYLAIGVALGGLVALGAPLIVTKWLNLRELSPDVAVQAVRLMGLFLVFQWSTGLYLAALTGLQRQVELNVVTSVATSVRSIGSLIILWKVSSSIVAFYWWQVIGTGIYFVVCREAVWRAPGVSRASAAFRWSVVGRVRGFAAGVTALSFASVAATQLDKVVLTRLVPLESFGYYSFATSIATAATFFAHPVYIATYPAMIEAYTGGDRERLTALFHRGAQLVSVAVFAPAAVLCAFSPVVLHLWARDASTAENASKLVSACLLGSALNGAALMPYNLTLAAGRVRPAMLAAVSGMFAYAIVLALFAVRWGVMAGAVGGAVAGVVQLFIYSRFAVSPLLPGQARRWVTADLMVPLATAACVAVGVRALSPPQVSPPLQMTGLVLASMGTLICTALMSPVAREEITNGVRTLLARRPL